MGFNQFFFFLKKKLYNKIFYPWNDSGISKFCFQIDVLSTVYIVLLTPRYSYALPHIIIIINMIIANTRNFILHVITFMTVSNFLKKSTETSRAPCRDFRDFLFEFSQLSYIIHRHCLICLRFRLFSVDDTCNLNTSLKINDTPNPLLKSFCVSFCFLTKAKQE